MNRWACVHDLANYFRKLDLLGGLTILELKLLRQNIGIVDYTGEGGTTEPYETNYTNFISLLNASNLTTGVRYVIKDFLTIYSSNVTNSGGHKISWGKDINPSTKYTLIITALTSSVIDPRIIIQEHTDWVVEFDPTMETLEDGVTTLGKITFLMDGNGNSAPYDFKNIRFRRTKSQIPFLPSTEGDCYTFSDVSDGEIIDSSTLSNTKFNVIKKDSWNNVFFGDTYNNIIETECTNNTFVKGMHDSMLLWGSTNNTFNEPVCYASGSVYNKTILSGDTTLSTTITKTILKVNDATIVSFLDPITYSYQVIII